MSKRLKKKRAQILKISTCGVLAALSYCLLALGSVVEILDFSAVVAASFGIVFCVVEMGYSYAWLTYAVTSVIAFLLLPGSRFAALVYLFFGGIYPILKSFIERTKKPVAVIIKTVYINLTSIAVWLLTSWLMPENEYVNKFIFIAFVAMVNFAFWLYDILVTRVVTMYVFSWKRRLNIKGFDKFRGNS